MFNYKVVELSRSEVNVVSLHCPVWEVPVLAYVHGEEKVKVVGDFPVNKAIPDPQSEFERLRLKYRSNRESGNDIVAEVYGSGPIGIRNLADAIRTVSEFDPAGETAEAGDLGELFEDVDPTAGLFDDAPVHAEGATPVEC